MKLRVGTRRSALALTQTGQTMETLAARVSGLSYEIVEVTTTGDRILDRPLREAGGKGLFIKELDEALLEGRIDCAVHSLKDVPSELAAGTIIAAVLQREDPRDVLVTRDGRELAELGDEVVLGTTSLRRASQLLSMKPAATTKLLRGNIETRLRKLVEGDCDATFLAAAGLARLGLTLSPAHGVMLDPFVFVPAAGQGAVAITVREGDGAAAAAIREVDHAATSAAVEAERAFARVFGGGCHLPLAAYAVVDGAQGEVRLVGVLLTADGKRIMRDEIRGPVAQAAALGTSLGRAFLERGGGEFLEAAEVSAGDGKSHGRDV